MTSDEIFERINLQMYEGIVMHSDMRQIYQFLNLDGYAACQDYHYCEEIENQSALQRFYIDTYFKLLPVGEMKRRELIPNSWYKYTSQEVDIGTKRNAIKELMGKWIAWEKETKHLYEEMYLELIGIKEIAAALYVSKLVKDVSEELSSAQKSLLDLEAIGFNLDVIIDWQDTIKKKYKKRSENK